jgi:hypothetical protein
MTKDPRLTPEEIERLLAGRGPERPGLDAALRRVRSEFSAAPDPEVRTKHLAAMAAAFGQATPTPARIRHRRRFVRRAAIGSVAFVLVGGSALAATGSLPRPAQDAVAKVAHDVGLNLPHSTQVTNPRAVQNPGVQFANTKKAWLDCEKAGRTDCGPKPSAKSFVHPATTPSSEPSEGPGNSGDHSQGHGPDATHTPHPTDQSGDHGATPRPTATPHVDGGDHGDGGSHTPEPTDHSGD